VHEEGYIHARISADDRAMLEELKRATGRTESEIVRRGLALVAKQDAQQRSALKLAGRSAGLFKKGTRDLSTNKKHLESFGE